MILIYRRNEITEFPKDIDFYAICDKAVVCSDDRFELSAWLEKNRIVYQILADLNTPYNEIIRQGEFDFA